MHQKTETRFLSRLRRFFFVSVSILIVFVDMKTETRFLSRRRFFCLAFECGCSGWSRCANPTYKPQNSVYKATPVYFGYLTADEIKRSRGSALMVRRFPMKRTMPSITSKTESWKHCATRGPLTKPKTMTSRTSSRTWSVCGTDWPRHDLKSLPSSRV